MIAKIFQTITLPSVTFDLMTLITGIIVGLIAGALASFLIRGRYFGLLTSVIIGLVGALLGNFLFSLLHITDPFHGGGLTLRSIDILVAFIGAVLILLIVGSFYRRRY